MSYPLVNATGWSELIDGNIVGAAFTMFDTAFAGWTVAILFVVYQGMLFLKTKNPMTCVGTGLIFASMYISTSFITQSSKSAIFLILLFEIAVILYTLFTK